MNGEQVSSLEATLNHEDREEIAKRGYSVVKNITRGLKSSVFLVEFKNVDESESSFPHEVKNFLACKVIDTEFSPKDFTRYLRRELDILAKIDHPNIIYLHGILQRHSKYMIFMRYAEFGNLCEFLIINGAVKEKPARLWLHQILTALMYLHELNIAHRDLKCDNILITAHHNIKLCDFGFSRFVVDSKGKKVMSYTYCGSIAYAAPELLRGLPYKAKIADLWSVGIVLFAMLNQSFPFHADNVMKLWLDQTNKRYRFITKIRMRVSDEVVELVSGFLEPDVHKRITSKDALTSSWMAKEPKLMYFTADERTAFERATAVRDVIHVPGYKKPAINDPSKHSIEKLDITDGDVDAVEEEIFEEILDEPDD